MKAGVCVPWRGGDPLREAAWERVHTFWENTGLPVFTGDSGHEPFNRAASRNAAAKEAGDWDVAMFADADCLVERHNVLPALDLALQHNVVVFPHNRYHSLDRRERLYQTSKGPTSGGVLAISRTAWDLLGGYDERFAGWGYEDAAFKIAFEQMLGEPIRLSGVMRELFHVKTRSHRPASDRTLFEEYRRWSRM